MIDGTVYHAVGAECGSTKLRPASALCLRWPRAGVGSVGDLSRWRRVGRGGLIRVRHPDDAHMEWETVVFEKGVEVRFDRGMWSVPPHVTMNLGTLQECIAVLRPLRPLLFRHRRSDDSSFRVIARADGRRIMELAVSQLDFAGLNETNVANVHNVAHNVRGALYHFHEMAEAYARITNAHARYSASVGGADVAMLAGDAAVYFEFEAFVSSIRRAYDSMRYALWQKYEPSAGSVPRSLKAALQALRSLPVELHARLSDSWTRFGVPITDYRDCLHHYVPLAMPGAPLLLVRGHLGVWTLLARLPDNPSAKAARLFTFKLDIDALTFAYECLDEIITIATLAAESVGSDAMVPLKGA
jgi:hypothetical protein